MHVLKYIKDLKKFKTGKGNRGYLMINYAEKYKDMIGQKFGRLTVLGICATGDYRGPQVSCVCDCGKKKIVWRVYLMRRKTKSCGCLALEQKRKFHDRKYLKEINPVLYTKIEELYEI